MKIPAAKKLPSGSWRVQVSVSGQRYSVIAPTKKDAEREAAAIKSGARRVQAKVSPLTVGEAIDQYIESKSAVLSPSTIAGYKRIRKNDMQSLMLTRLGSVTQQTIQRAVNEMSKTKSPKSVRNAHGLLSATLAVYRPDLILNTAMPQKVRYDVAIPSDDDVKTLLAAVRGERDEIPILLAVWLGLRMSEILGLRWDDIDGDILHIRRARVDEGIKGTKTYSSQRDLPIPSYILNLLSTAPRTSEYIVPVSRRALYSRFQVICKHAGMQHYRFHDLRHINASVMLAIGIPNKYAQERMGHATDNMLKTIYQHTMSKERIATARKVDEYFEQKICG